MVAQKVFVFYNTVLQQFDGVATHVTAGLCIRDQAPRLYRINPHFDKDYELREYGTINEDGSFTPVSLEDGSHGFVVHSWDEWKNPEQEVQKESK